VPKIIINGTINLFFNCSQPSANIKHSSFRVLFDKIASVCFIGKLYCSNIVSNEQLAAVCEVGSAAFKLQ